MAKTKRWGDTYFDRRDWHKYNNQLVKTAGINPSFSIEHDPLAHRRKKTPTFSYGD